MRPGVDVSTPFRSPSLQLQSRELTPPSRAVCQGAPPMSPDGSRIRGVEIAKIGASNPRIIATKTQTFAMQQNIGKICPIWRKSPIPFANHFAFRVRFTPVAAFPAQNLPSGCLHQFFR